MNFIFQLIIGLVLTVASTLIKSIFQQDNQQKQKVAGVRGSIQTGGNNPLAFIMGFYGTAGHLKYAGSWGNDGETPNAYYSKAISVSDLPIRGYTGFFVNGERVTLNATETGDLGYAVLEYRVNGKDHLWIKPYLGTQTTPDALLRSKFGSSADRPYTADMIARGVAYYVATALVNRELFSGFPEYFAEVNGIALDDPRPGSPQHDNPIVGIYTILRGIYFAGAWVYGPQSIGPSRLPQENWQAQMDKCDAIVEGQKRFRFGIEVSVDQEPQAIIGEILKACEGRIAEIGGIYKVLVGEPGNPVVAITDEDIVITEQQTFDPFPGLDALFNGMNATYPEPAESWESKEAPPRYRSDLEAQDDGRRLPFSTDYKAVPYPVQVQALMRAAIEETRRFRRVTRTMPPEWWEYEPLDVWIETSARNGWVDKQFIITAMDDLPNGNQFVGGQEIDPSDYGWSSDYELPWDTAPLVIARPAPQRITGWSVSPYVFFDGAMQERKPGIEVSFAGGLTDVRAVRVQVRLGSEAGATVFDGDMPYDPSEAEPTRSVFGNFILPNTIYVVRGVLQPFSGRPVEWSDWLSVTTPDIPDVTDIQVSQLGQYLAGAVGFLTGSTPGTVQDQINELRAQFGDLANAVVTGDETSKRRISTLFAHSGAATAGIIRNETAIAEEERARAELTEEVFAIREDLSAQGFLKFEAEVDEAGSTAQITAKVKATSGSTFSEAAWMLRAEADGSGGSIGQFGVLGTMYVFDGESGDAIPVFSASADGVKFRDGIFSGTFRSEAMNGAQPRFFFNGQTGNWRLGA